MFIAAVSKKKWEQKWGITSAKSNVSSPSHFFAYKRGNFFFICIYTFLNCKKIFLSPYRGHAKIPCISQEFPASIRTVKFFFLSMYTSLCTNAIPSWLRFVVAKIRSVAACLYYSHYVKIQFKYVKWW